MGGNHSKTGGQSSLIKDCVWFTNVIYHLNQWEWRTVGLNNFPLQLPSHGFKWKSLWPMIVDCFFVLVGVSLTHSYYYYVDNVIYI